MILEETIVKGMTIMKLRRNNKKLSY